MGRLPATLSVEAWRVQARLCAAAQARPSKPKSTPGRSMPELGFLARDLSYFLLELIATRRFIFPPFFRRSSGTKGQRARSDLRQCSEGRGLQARGTKVNETAGRVKSNPGCAHL